VRNKCPKGLPIEGVRRTQGGGGRAGLQCSSGGRAWDRSPFENCASRQGATHFHLLFISSSICFNYSINRIASTSLVKSPDLGDELFSKT
jgi:hypothetical protein